MIRISLALATALLLGACAMPLPPYQLAITADPNAPTASTRYSDVAAGTRTFRPVTPSASGWGAPDPKTDAKTGGES